MIETIRVPVWLVAVTGMIFLGVILEQLYVSKRPVDLWGLKLNQPAVLDEPIASSTQPPIGSIVAWHKDLFGVPKLPDHWVECNGQHIEDKSSPMVGQLVPNLNGEDRFLRGSKTSGQDQEQDWKSFYLAGHGPGPFTHDDVLIPKNGYNTIFPFGGKFESDGKGNANQLRVKFDDSEVRPKNMSVVWVMRIK